MHHTTSDLREAHEGDTTSQVLLKRKFMLVPLLQEGQFALEGCST